MFYSLALSCEADNALTFKEVMPLDEFGLLMAVADGMGGMNAGEVASQVAIDTVKFFFAPGKLTKKSVATKEARQSYMEKVIVAANDRIIQMAREREDRRGMGSTLIMLWIYEDEVTVTWIGDSRAYRYNDKIGLQPLSQDHSYVQELVNAGSITYDQAFDHPQANIITRSLGDPSKKANPDTKHYTVYDGDIFLLCSDGLSGVLRDGKIEEIISNYGDTVTRCQEELWKAARDADWYDNVTTMLCRMSGGEPCPADARTTGGEIKPYWKKSIHLERKYLGIFALIGILLIGAVVVLAMLYSRGTNPDAQPVQEQLIQQTDTVGTAPEEKVEYALPADLPDISQQKAEPEIRRQPLILEDAPPVTGGDELTPISDAVHDDAESVFTTYESDEKSANDSTITEINHGTES